MSTLHNTEYPYNHCIRTYKKESTYIGFIDIDEFIVLRTNELFNEFMKKYDQYSGLAIHWLTFGSTNHYLESNKLVTESYFLRPPANHTSNQLVKSIVVNPRKIISFAKRSFTNC